MYDHLFDELMGLEYHEIEGSKYERVNALTEKDLDEQELGARVRDLVGRGNDKNRLGQPAEGKAGKAAVPAKREEVTAATPTQPATAKPAYGADNKLVTQDRAEDIRKKLREKLNQLNAGIDPEILAL